MKTRTTALGALATLVVAGAVATVPAVPAFAAASVSVVSELGGANADPDYATTVTVNASGFQSIKGGMGGVYVLFGWVDSGWKPSNGGQVGADYRYVPDSEAKDNAGFQRFVAFPGSSTKDSAQATMSDDGSFSVTMTIPGASFESTDRNGKVSTVNCLEVTCGIITIGAHGIKNANNETFTPITFMSGVGQAKPQTQPTAQPTAQAAQAAAKAPKVVARVGIAHATVTAGTSVVFTGQGFTPGEQVIVDFAQGASSVGPLVAGDAGEVAASVPVPATIRSGTHVVTLTGAASGQVAEAEVSVTGGTTPEVATPTSAEQTPVWLLVTLLSAILVAGLLLIASIVLSIVRAVRRRRGRKASAATVVPAVVREPAEDADTVPLDVVVGKA